MKSDQSSTIYALIQEGAGKLMSWSKKKGGPKEKKLLKVTQNCKKKHSEQLWGNFFFDLKANFSAPLSPIFKFKHFYSFNEAESSIQFTTKHISVSCVFLL